MSKVKGRGSSILTFIPLCMQSSKKNKKHWISIDCVEEVFSLA